MMNRITQGKLLVASLSLVFVGGAYGALSWDSSPGVDLSDFGIQTNWLVFMYQDVDTDSGLSTLVFDNTTEAPASGTGYADDIFMGAPDYQTTVLDNRGSLEFGTTIAPGWETTYGGASVYTVAINSDSWATATQTRIFDATPNILGNTDPDGYVAPEPQNDWVNVIPEPSTLAFLAFGGMGFLLRRKFIKA